MFLNKKVREKDILFQKFLAFVLKNMDQGQAQGLITDIVQTWNLQVPLMKRKTSTFDFMNGAPSMTSRVSNNSKSVHQELKELVLANFLTTQ